ncbi:hypothetical protein [Mycolicibacterium mucogenicum]|uniref:Uncharacterized protein n=1 Tax=Mycolicibacterium mucogenicum DSM 44124 TaxID=1226753 RepID=A0A8H2J8Y9_MYCMU|nr:hypothetical protein [Mycolicibacterium mucogenicum]KAB7761215.1 hypothetical protein MMUC44124_01190 [Mycolicibacterium mucogenicum DSM 44124]QPG70039.1 hypothetical protein C1S78_003155 [Mycolicibacterium mucogenicum DSM 44124]
MTVDDCPTVPNTRPLQMIWSPADAAAAAVDAKGHGVPLSPVAARGRGYRGQHRANRFSRRVSDIKADL